MADLDALLTELRAALAGSAYLDIKIAIARGEAPADAFHSMDDPEGGCLWSTPAYRQHQADLEAIHQREGASEAFRAAVRAAPGDTLGSAPPYTSSIVAALGLLQPDWFYSIHGGTPDRLRQSAAVGRWVGEGDGDNEEIDAFAATPALALCIAVLEADRAWGAPT